MPSNMEFVTKYISVHMFARMPSASLTDYIHRWYVYGITHTYACTYMHHTNKRTSPFIPRTNYSRS